MEIETSTVRVGVRIRPRTPEEIVDGCDTCTTVTPGEPQVWIGGTHAFTYDYVFDNDASQEAIFQNVQSLIDGCLEGYNATIITYGQTGSGKTYTMGTGLDTKLINSNEIHEGQGIVPRALNYLFSKINTKVAKASNQKEPVPEFRIRAQFIEIYNEEIIDLISTSSNSKSSSNRLNGGGDNESFYSSNRAFMNQRRASNNTSPIKIHEEPNGGIYLVGAETQVISSIYDALECLRTGVLSRSTASTNMNDKSSRSHAVYTIYIEQRSILEPLEGEIIGNKEEHEILTAKFHFVDLAGSERLKRTGAVGDRAKEGISINCGLLSLGNVISALGDKSKKALHIPYRDSKLTRLLQDSLGGNSRTVMIACVSPCDRDFVETLNTLKYANRTRNIKNKVTINQNKSSRTIALLRQEISLLQMELFEFKQGKNPLAKDYAEEGCYFQDNILLKSDNEFLQKRIIALQQIVEQLTHTNSELLAEKAAANWSTPGTNLTEIIKKYTLDIEDLRGRLYESEAICEILMKQNSQYQIMFQKSNYTSQQNHHNYEIIRNELRRIIRPLEDDSINTRTTFEQAEVENDDNDLETEDQIVCIDEQILTKERLIEQLELSNRRALNTKENYEEQIKELYDKIKKTESERDTLLSANSQQNGQQSKSNNSQNRNQVQLREYENKLSKLQIEMKRMQDGVREHDKLVRKNASTEKQLFSLKQEVESMKRLKVKLMNQLKDENVKWRANENKRLREIAKLKKEQRKKDNVIRTLETRGQLNDQLLKRRHEEIKILKKLSKSKVTRVIY